MWLSVATSSASLQAEEFHPVSDREFLLSVIAEHDRLYQQRFDAQEKALTSALTAAKEAVDKAQSASEKRFDSVNEFRNQLKDQAATFLTRAEYQAFNKQLTDQIASILATQVPRSEHETRWHADAANISGLQTRIEQLSQRQYTSSGQAEGSAWLWGIIIGVVGIAISVAIVLTNIFRKSHPG